jgi:ABC-2 type transport system ATP-binding protein
LRHLTRTTINAETVRPATGLADLPGIHGLQVDGWQVRFEVDAEHLDSAVAALSRLGVRSLVSHPPTLELLLLRHDSDDVARTGEQPENSASASELAGGKQAGAGGRPVAQ